MPRHVEIIDTDIDTGLLANELLALYTQNNFDNNPQISLQSVDGNDDWYCSIGRIKDCDYPEHYYSVINKSLKGTYIEKCINRYPDYYRWRCLLLNSRQTYSIHTDALFANKDNFRLHIPVISNKESFLCFYDSYPKSGYDVLVRYEHLEVGNSYRVNTTGLHTAVNHGTDVRIHLVGVKYENSYHRTH
jgi:hypothetical protein